MAGRLCCCLIVGERARRTKEFFITQDARNEAALGRGLATSQTGTLPGPPEKVVQAQFTRNVLERCGNPKAGQGARELRAHGNCRRPEFEVHGAHDANVPFELQFHVGKRQVGRTQYNSISLRHIKLRTRESPAMFYQEERSGRTDRSLERIEWLVLHDAHDTSRQEFGKRECVVTSDLRVDELRIRTALARGTAARRADPKPLPQGLYGTGGGPDCNLLKREKPRLIIVEVLVDERGRPRRKRGLQTGNLIEHDTENRQPIDQAVVRKPAECEELLDAGAETPALQCVVKVGRNVEANILGKQGARGACHIGQGQTPHGQYRTCARSNRLSSILEWHAFSRNEVTRRGSGPSSGPSKSEGRLLLGKTYEMAGVQDRGRVRD